MKKILVATDFSARSDRAIRRATLLAKKFEATLSLVHVVDDDRPRRIVDPEREAASVLLSEQARSLHEIDGVDCTSSVVLGTLSDELIKATQASAADVLIIGPHRHHSLQDVFLGTTAERTIRTSRHPLLVAGGVPASFYRHVLVAVDLSDCSGDALRAVAGLDLDNDAAISVVHVFDAPSKNYMSLGSASNDDIKDYLAREEARAAGELAEFLRGVEFSPVRQVVKFNESYTAHVILRYCARCLGGPHRCWNSWADRHRQILARERGGKSSACRRSGRLGRSTATLMGIAAGLHRREYRAF